MQPFDTETHTTLARLLGKSLPALMLGKNVLSDAAIYLAPFLPSKSALLVADTHTFAVAGKALAAALESTMTIQALTLQTPVSPSVENANRIANHAAGTQAIIAVGSGTISDLCKFASHQIKLPYVIVPTAPSMNGYTSVNASLIQDGHKQSLPAHLPVAILIDEGVVANAPLRMIRAGIGDSMARPTAQADWLLSHFHTQEQYDPRPYELMRSVEEDVFSQVSALMARDERAVCQLMKLLLLAGFGMTIAGSSRPASGAEHMIAHLMESRFGGESLHGEQIAVTAFSMLKLQRQLLPGLKPEIRRAIEPVLWTEDRFQRIGLEAGLSLEPESLGWKQEEYSKAIREAKDTRPRYTFLNLLDSR